MKQQFKLDQQGQVIEETFTQPTITISHSRKVSDNNYGSNDYFVAMQLDVAIGASDAEKQTAITNGFRLIRTMIDSQHDGSLPTITEQRLIEDFGGEIIEMPSKPAPRAIEHASEANKPATKEGLWNELVSNPSRWFVNPPARKTNPKAPDFRRKGTGEGLWISDAPKPLVKQAAALIEAAV